uniref:Uncharacterized protein n=1 Tax=Syphacia muris TaxID=451379 RepID=A0A0N5AVF7_9BILA
MKTSLENIFRWVSQTTFPYSVRSYEVNDSDKEGADIMMIDLMVEQVQNEVVQLETRLDTTPRECPAKKTIPDYSWLISKSSARRRKYLSFQEKLAVETICAPIKHNEWSNLIMNWRARIKAATDRNQIIDALRYSVDEIVHSRPKKHSIGDVLYSYLRHKQSINSIGDQTSRSDNMELKAVDHQGSFSDRYTDLARIV